MPQCQYCDQTFGNAGAVASHENACDEKPSAQQPEPQRAEPAQSEPQRTEPPQREPQNAAPPARQQQGGQAPATQSNAAVETGMQLGQALAEMSSGSPEEQAESKGTIFQTAGAALAQFGAQAAEREKQQIQNAKARGNEDIEVAHEYPNCPECGGQLRSMPPEGEEFPCEHCGTILR